VKITLKISENRRGKMKDSWWEEFWLFHEWWEVALMALWTIICWSGLAYLLINFHRFSHPYLFFYLAACWIIFWVGLSSWNADCLMPICFLIFAWMFLGYDVVRWIDGGAIPYNPTVIKVMVVLFVIQLPLACVCPPLL